MNNDREYIKEMFDSDGIKAPESLSEESMLAMLSASEEKQEEIPAVNNYETKQVKARPSLKRWMAIAAVAVVAFFGISGLREMLTAPPDTSTAGGELYTFRSESEIEKLLSSIAKDQGNDIILSHVAYLCSRVCHLAGSFRRRKGSEVLASCCRWGGQVHHP